MSDQERLFSVSMDKFRGIMALLVEQRIKMFNLTMRTSCLFHVRLLKDLKGVPFVNRRYKKEVPIMPIWYIKG